MVAMAKYVCGFTALAAAAAALDSCALVQLDARALAPDVPPLAAVSSRHQVAGELPPIPEALSGMIHDLERSLRGNGGGSPLGTSQARPLEKTRKSGRNDPLGSKGSLNMQDMLRFLKSLLRAARHDLFMERVSNLQKEFRETTKSAADRCMSRVEDFAAKTDQAADLPEAIAAAVQFFNDNTQAMQDYSRLLSDSATRAFAKLPSECRNDIEPTLKGMISMAKSKPLIVPDDASSEVLCGMASIILANLTNSLTLSGKVRGMSNASKAMMPMMKEYLNSAAPDVAARVMYVVRDTMDTFYVDSMEVERGLSIIVKDVPKILAKKVHCALPKSLARPRLGLGLGAALLAALLALLAGS